MQPWLVSNYNCFENCGNCLYGLLCPACAIATARSNFDGSDCCFNWLCMGMCMARSIIRTGYVFPVHRIYINETQSHDSSLHLHTTLHDQQVQPAGLLHWGHLQDLLLHTLRCLPAAE